VFELKNAVEVVQAEDGKFYVDAATPVAGSVVHAWRKAPFVTETKARTVYDASSPRQCLRSCTNEKKKALSWRRLWLGMRALEGCAFESFEAVR